MIPQPVGYEHQTPDLRQEAKSYQPRECPTLPCPDAVSFRFEIAAVYATWDSLDIVLNIVLEATPSALVIIKEDGLSPPDMHFFLEIKVFDIGVLAPSAVEIWQNFGQKAIYRFLTSVDTV